MSEEITLIVSIDAKTEQREKVRKRLVELAEKTRLESGNICYILHEVPAKPDQFIIYEKWQNQAALDFHMAQDYLQEFIDESEILLSQQIKGTVCQEL